MLVLENTLVQELVDADAAIAALETAFREFGRGEAAVHRRVRTSLAERKLSTMGAIMPTAGILGAKVYTTIDENFRFVVLLFDAESGRPLVSIEADALTEIRTAAVSCIAARKLGVDSPATTAIFGAGSQAANHIRLLASQGLAGEVRVASRSNADAFCRELEEECGISVRPSTPRAALLGADLVVTATRSTTPLFPMEFLESDACVLAIGSTLPACVEVGPDVFAAARRVVVEWLPQTREEAGDLREALRTGVLAEHSILDMSHLLLAFDEGHKESATGLRVFKSVGVGLADIAIATDLYQRFLGAKND